MSPKPKPSLDIVFGLGKKGKGPESDEPPPDSEPDMGGSEDLDQACDELLAALGLELPPEQKKAACEALESFVTLVMSKGEAPDDGGEEEPE